MFRTAIFARRGLNRQCAEGLVFTSRGGTTQNAQEEGRVNHGRGRPALCVLTLAERREHNKRCNNPTGSKAVGTCTGDLFSAGQAKTIGGIAQ
ncbi:MAG: hypothetical protein AB7S92_21480 [Parvibaculaceae bacterium]